jgi:DNA-binding XRE family transcriptional regulator
MVEAVEPFASSQHAINVKQTARNELPTLLKTFPKPLDKTQSGKDKKSALRTLMGHCISLSSENTPNWLCHFPARNSHISQQLDDWFAQLEASASEKDRPLLDKAKKKAIPMAQAINGWHAYIDATQICSKKLPVLKGRTLTAKGIFARAVKEEFATTIKTARYLLDPIRTQQSLADELGCSKQAINLWENPEKLTNYLEADRFQALKEIYRSRVPHIFKPTVEKLINRMDTLYTARPKAIARTQKAGEAVTPVALGKGSPGS